MHDANSGLAGDEWEVGQKGGEEDSTAVGLCFALDLEDKKNEDT